MGLSIGSYIDDFESLEQQSAITRADIGHHFSMFSGPAPPPPPMVSSPPTPHGPQPAMAPTPATPKPVLLRGPALACRLGQSGICAAVVSHTRHELQLLNHEGCMAMVMVAAVL